MSEFNNPPLLLKVASINNPQTPGEPAPDVKYPRSLLMFVSDAEQLAPIPSGPGATAVLLLSGTAGLHDPVVDPAVSFGIDDPRTINLALQVAAPMPPDDLVVVGSAAVTALSEVAPSGTDPFSVATTNAKIVHTALASDDKTKLPRDLYLLSDVFGADGAHSDSLIYRVAYQGTTLLSASSALPAPFPLLNPESFVHKGAGAVIDLDVNNPSQVASPATLQVGINGGHQLLPQVVPPCAASSLLVFTGTALCNAQANQASTDTNFVARVRLRFPMSGLVFVGEASVAGLASIRGDTSEVYTRYFAGNARVVADPSDPPDGGLPVGLPKDELYLLIDITAYVYDDGEDPVQVLRVAYQANVLVGRSGHGVAP